MADERREQIILDFEVDEGASIESINSLTKANKALREERKNLNLLTAEGRKRTQEINAQIDQNTSKVKANVSAIEQQKINIGNYRSALDGVHPALGKVGQGLEAGTQGFKAMTLQALRFIATPIGAILAALVAVFSLLKAALSQNAELMDKFENITNAAGVIIEIVVSRVGKLGEALIALAQGNFSEAINKTSQAFGGLADEIENAVRQQQLFLDASRDLEDSQRNLRIEQARATNQIKLLEQASKNSNLTFDQQEEKLRQALDLQADLIKTREDVARRDLLITARQLRSAAEFQQTSNETFDQYIERLLNTAALGDEELDKLVEKIEAVEQARGDSLAFQQKLENDLAKIQEKRAAALEKQNEALAEQAALERATRRAQGEGPAAGEDPLVGAFETRAKVITDINDRMNDDLVKRNKDADAEITANKKKAAQIQEEVERSKAGIIANFAGATSQLFREESEGHKILSSAQAVINTYLAATAALASGSKINPVFGALSSASAIITGLAAVAEINNVQFAEGGYTGPGGKWDVAGVVHKDEYVVPKRVKNLPQAQPHIAAIEQMRLRGYADGGLVTNSISGPVNQTMELLNIVKNLPPQELSVVEFNKKAKRVKVKEQFSKR